MEHPLLLPKYKYNHAYKSLIQPFLLLFCPLLIIVRLFIILPALITSAVIDFLLNVGTNSSSPLPLWRIKVFQYAKAFLYRVVLLALGWILVVEGKPNMTVKTIMFNHCCSLDVLAFTAAG